MIKIPKWGFPGSWGYRQSSSILNQDFPIEINPAIGVPPDYGNLETPKIIKWIWIKAPDLYADFQQVLQRPWLWWEDPFLGAKQQKSTGNPEHNMKRCEMYRNLCF